LGRLRDSLIDRCRRWRLSRPRIDRLASYPELPDLPAELERHTFALCGPDSAPKWAAFECPCGRKHRIVVSLQATHDPRWRFSTVASGPSLWPSIDSRGEFRCHFWLEDGRVHWVKDRRPQTESPA
jgi:hypothetical protein